VTHIGVEVLGQAAPFGDETRGGISGFARGVLH